MTFISDSTLDKPKIIEAVSVFIQPLQLESPDSLNDYKWSKINENGFDDDDIRIVQLKEWQEEIIEYGTIKIQARLLPKIGWIKKCEWVALIIEAHLNITDNDLYIDDLLSFNVGFRKSRGLPVPDNSHFEMNINNYLLSNGKPCSDIYKRYADEIFGMNKYKPLLNLQKSVILSLGRFDRILTDKDLYRFGSVAYPHEQISDEWVNTARENMVDRWIKTGWRCFAYSYSMVYALNESYPGRLDDKIRGNFLDKYVRTGVTIALHRAMLQELPLKLKQAESLAEMRKCHQEMARINNYVGVRWTSEGTQNTKIEQIWRKATGIEDRMNEVKLLLEEKIDVYEAQEADRLNNGIFILQIIFGAFYGAQIGLALGSDFVHLILGMVIGLVLIFIFIWLEKRIKILERIKKMSIFK